MSADDRLVLKGVPEELRRKLAVRAAQEGCFPRDIAIRALELYLAGGGGVGGSGSVAGAAVVYAPNVHTDGGGGRG